MPFSPIFLPSCGPQPQIHHYLFVRELAKDSAHAGPKALPTELLDAHDIVRFFDFPLPYLYDLPRQLLSTPETGLSVTAPYIGRYHLYWKPAISFAILCTHYGG